jgi:hypothetical protein
MITLDGIPIDALDVDADFVVRDELLDKWCFVIRA